MTFTAIGDLAKSLQLRSDTARVSADIQRHASEVASGRTSDLSRRTGGDFGPLAGIERRLTRIDAFATTATEAAQTAKGMQAALTRIREQSEGTTASLLQAATEARPAPVTVAGGEALSRFGSVVEALNTEVGGRSVFAGVSTQGTALRPAGEILDALRAEIGGQTDPAEIAGTVAAWFAPGGGFETDAFTGSATPRSDLRIGEDEAVSLDVTAADPGIRGMIGGFALGALVGDGILAGDADGRADLLGRAAGAMMSAGDAFVATQARVGTIEARADEATARNTAQRGTLAAAKDEIVGVDRYDSAVRLTAAETQLDMMHALTARLSRLSLTNHL